MVGGMKIRHRLMKSLGQLPDNDAGEHDVDEPSEEEWDQWEAALRELGEADQS